MDLAAAASEGTSRMDAHLLDLPHVLLVDVLSRQHCSAATARSAAGTCRDLRQATLATVTAFSPNASRQNLAPALIFARSLPMMRRVSLRQRLNTAVLHALAALTGLEDLQLDVRGGDGSTETETWEQRLSTLTTLSRLQRLSIDAVSGINQCCHHCNRIDSSAMHLLPAFSQLRTLSLKQPFGHAQQHENSAVGTAAIAFMTTLTRLDLSHHNLSTPGAAAALTTLTALQWLSLRGCMLQAADGAAVAQLTALAHLDLAANHGMREGLWAVATLTALRHLNLHNCMFRGVDTAAVSMLTALTYLDLRWNSLEDAAIAVLTALTALAHVDLGACGSVGDRSAAALTALTALTHLSLAYCQRVGADGWAALSTLPLLQSLDVSWEDPLQPGEAAVLATITQLSSLNISHWEPDDESIGPGVAAQLSFTLTALTRLDMACRDDQKMIPEVGGALAAALTPLTALKHLNISRHCLGDAGAAELVALTALEHLDCWDNLVSGVGVAALATLSALTHLDLMGNPIACASVAALTTLTALDTLVLPMSSLAGADALACLPSLASLCACGCFLGDLSGEGIRALGALTQLRVLTLWGSDMDMDSMSESQSEDGSDAVQLVADAAQQGADTAAALAMLPAVVDVCREEQDEYWFGIPSE